MLYMNKVSAALLNTNVMQSGHGICMCSRIRIRIYLGFRPGKWVCGLSSLCGVFFLVILLLKEQVTSTVKARGGSLRPGALSLVLFIAFSMQSLLLFLTVISFLVGCMSSCVVRTIQTTASGPLQTMWCVVQLYRACILLPADYVSNYCLYWLADFA